VGKQYVVTVTAFETDGATEHEEMTVIELRAPVEMLRQFAPAAVAAALGATEQEKAEQPRIGIVDPQPRDEGNYGSGQPKRRRRTKAEMEAARAGTAKEVEQAEGAERAQQYEANVASMPNSEAVTTSDPGKAEPQPAYNPFG